jgi:cellulose synthase/poly-beta-1,6-N-acetylglucosamine synthase-like glycosyltransferase
MMIAAIAISTILIYLFFMGWLTYGFDKVDDFVLQDLPSKTKFSIIIPFRNEATNLTQLLQSISKLNYSRLMFEVILVNDASDDNSVHVINQFISSNQDKLAIDILIIENIRLSNSPKKDAITTAVEKAKFNWIITTDADCIVPKYWLDAYDELIQINTPNCIVAPVTYKAENSFFNRFQTLDFLSLQGATIGGFGLKQPFMSNGANFGYQKSIFKSLKGFDGNSNIASGDDIFLLEKCIQLNKTKVNYLKSRKAIVTTKPAKNITDLIHQRVRWASKTSEYNNTFAQLVGIVVLLANLICVTGIATVVLGYLNVKTLIALFIIKFSIDFLLLFKTARFFKQDTLLLSYLFSSLLYPFYNIYVALLSLFKTYEWKGRTFKK